MPLNQLGTLYGSENYGADAAYYYLFCLSCAEPFASARENLRLVLTKNRRRYEEIKSMPGNPGSNEDPTSRIKDIKRFVVSFLGAIDYVLSNSSTLAPVKSQQNQQTQPTSTFDKIDSQRLQTMCQECLQQFNSCMFYVPKNEDEADEEETNELLATVSSRLPSSLNDELIFKLTLVVLMTIEQLKPKKNSTSPSKSQLSVYFTFVAFALVFFSHIVNHTIMRLEEALLEAHKSRMLEKVRVDDEEDDEDENDKVEESEDKKEREKKSKKKSSSKKKNLRLIYGHRRRKHNSDSDTNDDESDSDSFDENEDDESKVFNEFDEAEEEESESDEDRRAGSSKRRRRNVAKFIERENLSETEMMSQESSSHSSSDTSSNESDSDSSHSVSSSSSSSDRGKTRNKEISKKQTNEKSPKTGN